MRRIILFGQKKSDGDFDLIIPGGESKTLKCKAFFGSPSLEFSDRRINFASIPLNIPTKKETYLKNTSRVPAIFAIESPENFPDLKIEPITGVLPVGGIMKISMEYLPRHLHKFVHVCSRNYQQEQSFELSRKSTLQAKLESLKVQF